jgi:hypothetical protein
MNKVIGFLFVAIFFKANFASACLFPSFFLSNPSPFFQIGGTMTDTFSATVSANTTLATCEYFLTFDYGSSNSYTNRSVKMGSSTWPFQISSDISGLQILKKKPEATSCSDVLCGTLPAGSFYQTKSQNFTVLIDNTNDWRTAGTYQETVTVSLYLGTVANPLFITSRTLSLTAQSNKRADLSVVTTGGSFDINKTIHTMNFANGLTTGATGTADVVVKFNAGYSLFASSENAGKLKQANGNDTIDYTFKINGTTYAIPYWTQIATQSGTSPVSGKVNPVSITIGNTTGKAEGTYSDTISLTIQSNQ